MAGTAKSASKSPPLGFPAQKTLFAQSRDFLLPTRPTPRLSVKVRPSNPQPTSTHKHQPPACPVWRLISRLPHRLVVSVNVSRDALTLGQRCTVAQGRWPRRAWRDGLVKARRCRGGRRRSPTLQPSRPRSPSGGGMRTSSHAQRESAEAQNPPPSLTLPPFAIDAPSDHQRHRIPPLSESDTVFAVPGEVRKVHNRCA